MHRLSSLAFLFLAWPVFAGPVEEGLVQCRSLTSESERLSCYDQLADLTPASQQTSDQPRTAQPAVASGTAAASVASAQAADAAAEEFGLEFAVKDALEEITSTITSVSRNARGGLVLTLANNQLWQQSGSERLYLDEGDSVTIRRGAFSAFYLSETGKSRRYRFARVR